ncbi:MAG: hypothetical protein ACRDCE_16775 [Cetobacterium sp.]|uniref:hypothetical protein n=1 Tax=Cetobacterium sp. TaxID=2071632 RepID=UPI003EE5588D
MKNILMYIYKIMKWLLLFMLFTIFTILTFYLIDKMVRAIRGLISVGFLGTFLLPGKTPTDVYLAMGVLVIGSTLALMLSQGICHFLNKKMVQVWE